MKKIFFVTIVSLSMLVGLIFIITASKHRDPNLAVVSVITETEAGFDFQKYFTDPLSEGKTEANIRRGKGFFINKDGLVLTNAHVVFGGDKIQVKINNSQYYPAELVKVDHEKDLAFIKIDSKYRTPYLKIAQQEVLENEEIYTIDQSGKILKTNKDIEIGTKSFQNTVFTDLQFDIGDSGMPIFNNQKKVVAINMGITRGLGHSIATPISNLSIDEK